MVGSWLDSVGWAVSAPASTGSPVGWLVGRPKVGQALVPGCRLWSSPARASDRAERTPVVVGFVAEISHRIQELPGASGGHQHPSAGEVVESVPGLLLV